MDDSHVTHFRTEDANAAAGQTGVISDDSSGTKADVMDHAPDSGFGEKGILNEKVDDRQEISEED